MKAVEYLLWLILAVLIIAAARNANQEGAARAARIAAQDARITAEAAWTEPRCSELVRLERLLVSLRQGYTDEHPRMVALKANILTLIDALRTETNGNFVFECPPTVPMKRPPPPFIKLPS